MTTKFFVLINRLLPLATYAALSTLIIFLVLYPEYKKVTTAPPNTFYTMPHGITGDYYSYLAYIQEGRFQNAVTNPYDLQPSQPMYIYSFYIILGIIASILNVSNIQAYYAGLIVSLLITVIGSILLIRQMVPKKLQTLALLTAFLAGPLPNWKIQLFGKEFYTGTQSWTGMDIFGRIIHIPHHFFAISMYVITVYFLVKCIQSVKIRFAILSLIPQLIGTVMFAIPGLILTISCCFLWCYILCDAGITEKTLRINHKIRTILAGLSIFIILSIVPQIMIGQYLKTIGLPWNYIAQYEYAIFKPEVYPLTLSVFVMGVILLIPFCILAIHDIHSKHEYDYVLLFFLFLTPFILYIFSINGVLPINKGRFANSTPYLFGGIIAVKGIMYIQNILKQRAKKVTLHQLIVPLFYMLIIINFMLGLDAYWKPAFQSDRTNEAVYIPKKYMDILAYINEHQLSNILSAYYVGTYIPSFTSARVFLGQEVNTIDFWNRWKTVNTIFDNTMSFENFRSLVYTNNIQHLLWLNTILDKKYTAILQPEITIDNVTLFKVIEPAE